MQSLVVRFLCVIAAVVASLTALKAQAGTATANLAVSMQINASCTINAASLNFAATAGTALVASNVNASTTVSVTCTSGSPYSIGMDNGANASGSQRRMKNGANFLNYSLYVNPPPANPWITTGSPHSCTPAGLLLPRHRQRVASIRHHQWPRAVDGHRAADRHLYRYRDDDDHVLIRDRALPE